MEVPASTSRNQRNKYLSYILGVIVLFLLITYLIKNKDLLTSLKNIGWQPLLWIVLLDIMTFVISGGLDQSMIGRFDSRVSFWDCYMLGYANNFLNKILPTIGGGAAFRAVYLKKIYQLSYPQFISTIAGLYVISFLITSFIGMFCLVMIFVTRQVFGLTIFLAFMGIFLFCLGTIAFSPKIPESQNRLVRFVGSIFDGWHVLKKDPKLILIYAFFSVALLTLSTLQAYFSYQALGVQTNMISMVFLATLGIILAFLNFTPDGIGIKEGVYVFSSELVRIPDGILVLGSLVLRAISLCTTFVIGGICYLILLRRLSALKG
ncbi:MAG: flippase-like domain-containing protein [Anaerolineales bacterium]|nr:flippase-like domain-containing protein [Anaerolineales bacterium]MBP6208647.1 flippase-like domain-containing protein [Anaerolineales bacterium]